LRALSISELDAVPPDPTNRVADDQRAVALGHRLFFETRLSSNGKVSCATCHQPDRQFQDGTPLGAGDEPAGSGSTVYRLIEADATRRLVSSNPR
jgi:cytochrome c peroxidase